MVEAVHFALLAVDVCMMHCQRHEEIEMNTNSDSTLVFPTLI
jgi:hypothetical protein